MEPMRCSRMLSHLISLQILILLRLNGVGVYSDLTCTKDGWITDPKIKDVDGNPMKKVEFKPIIASEADAAKAQRDERAKQFTCVPSE